VLRQRICREHLNYYVGDACAEGPVAVFRRRMRRGLRGCVKAAHAQKAPWLCSDGACAEGSVAVFRRRMRRGLRGCVQAVHAQRAPWLCSDGACAEKKVTKLPRGSVIRWRQCCQGVLRHARENGRGFL
jgi:hypothetical protein